MSDASDNNKAALLEILGKVPSQCEGLEAQARDLLRLSREARDAAQYQEVVLKALPVDEPEAAAYCRRSIRGWQEFGQVAQHIGKVPVSSLHAAVSGNTSTATVGPAHIIRSVTLPPDVRKTIEQAESDYSNTARVDETFEAIKADMKRLDLDTGNARYRNPLDLLEEAYTAIRYPVSAAGGPSSALPNLRASIDRSIDELVRRRPAHFDSLSTNDGFVNDELSGKGKKDVTEWPGLLKQFLRGAQFLRALPASVDEARLQP